jgi:hypothetical protein
MSSVFTLVLTPLVFSYAIDLVQAVRKLFGREAKAVTTAPELET